MELQNPIWYLKKTCPCCEQGFPAFCMCPACGYLTVNCIEMGDTFINPRKLELGFTDICPNCGKTKTKEFINADADDIQNAGFTKYDYQ